MSSSPKMPHIYTLKIKSIALAIDLPTNSSHINRSNNLFMCKLERNLKSAV